MNSHLKTENIWKTYQMEQQIISSKSLKYQKKTMIKLPLKSSKSATGECPLPQVVLIPSTRDNSIVPGNGHDDLHHLVVPFNDDLLNGGQRELRKFSIMSLLSIMANNSQRPSIFSRYRLTAIF
jgi:hypothetical protein